MLWPPLAGHRSSRGHGRPARTKGHSQLCTWRLCFRAAFLIAPASQPAIGNPPIIKPSKEIGLLSTKEKNLASAGFTKKPTKAIKNTAVFPLLKGLKNGIERGENSSKFYARKLVILSAKKTCMNFFELCKKRENLPAFTKYEKSDILGSINRLICTPGLNHYASSFYEHKTYNELASIKNSIYQRLHCEGCNSLHHLSPKLPNLPASNGVIDGGGSCTVCMNTKYKGAKQKPWSLWTDATEG